MLDPAFVWRGRRIVAERGAAHVKRFSLPSGRSVAALSVGASEAFALPRLCDGLADVDVYLGAGPAARAVGVIGALTSAACKVPGGQDALHSLVNRAVKGSTGGPNGAARAQSEPAHILARVHDAAGSLLSEVRLESANVYTVTAELLAWAALAAADGALQRAGALGPVEAFGLDALERGAAEAGIAAPG
jgi:short subunit dehydrogenase-like uncharacterized protein